MRRQSYAQSMNSSNEPQIIVEETNLGEEETDRCGYESPPRCLDPDSPSLNPYLLSPWRETRKHSLPTPQCTSGITASQVRRLSERGGEGSGPSSREAAFLATLSSAPAPQPGGRRHSVVTISKVPPTLFGRGRRESIAALPSGAPRILPIRRDSSSTGPPSNSGSTHNLQLDIMDDIAEIKARKVRLKMWRTPSRERVCEVQTLEGNASTQRYVQQGQRRYSDFPSTTNQTASNTSLSSSSSSSLRRRSSEVPKTIGNTSPGIVCSNTDLISILNSLTSSATEINRCGDEPSSSSSSPPALRDDQKLKTIEQKRKHLKDFRSNSFDVSILNDTGNKKLENTINNCNNEQAPSSWFINRHQPMWKKQKSTDYNNLPTMSIKFEKTSSKFVKTVKDTIGKTTTPIKEFVRHKVVWDDKSGTKVDAQVLGSAIEEFLTAQRCNDTQNNITNKAVLSPGKQKSNKQQQQNESCEASLCSSLKDLFVK